MGALLLNMASKYPYFSTNRARRLSSTFAILLARDAQRAKAAGVVTVRVETIRNAIATAESHLPEARIDGAGSWVEAHIKDLQAAIGPQRAAPKSETVEGGDE